MVDDTKENRLLLRERDGLNVLYRGQVQKQRNIADQSIKKVEELQEQLLKKTEEISNLKSEVGQLKSVARSSNGKIYLLQFQLRKSARTECKSDQKTEHLLLHWKKSRKFIDELSKENLSLSVVISNDEEITGKQEGIFFEHSLTARNERFQEMENVVRCWVDKQLEANFNDIQVLTQKSEDCDDPLSLSVLHDSEKTLSPILQQLIDVHTPSYDITDTVNIISPESEVSPLSRRTSPKEIKLLFSNIVECRTPINLALHANNFAPGEVTPPSPVSVLDVASLVFEEAPIPTISPLEVRAMFSLGTSPQFGPIIEKTTCKPAVDAVHLFSPASAEKDWSSRNKKREILHMDTREILRSLLVGGKQQPPATVSAQLEQRAMPSSMRTFSGYHHFGSPPTESAASSCVVFPRPQQLTAIVPAPEYQAKRTSLTDDLSEQPIDALSAGRDVVWSSILSPNSFQNHMYTFKRKNCNLRNDITKFATFLQDLKKDCQI